MFFKDVFTELQESIMSAMNKKSKLCPNCKKGILKKNSPLQHYVEVAAMKFIGGCCAGVGAAVPAPDYRFTCPNCKSVFMLVEGKFVPVVKKRGGTDT